ncbi:MAG: BON domain-containing protein [Cardiobacteriaceae bacterium]|nr:BON domain-containing protein [Cardiobacteriaceae bacterium]
MIRHKLALLIATTLITSGCVPLLIGGAATGVTAVHDRRSVGTVIDDKTIALSLSAYLSRHSDQLGNSNVNVTAYNGIVLLTGETRNHELRQKIQGIASRQEGVRKVHNYLSIGRNSTLSERSYDTQQTAKVKTALFDISGKDFDPTRVKVVTEHGVTYLMGILSPSEARVVAQVARQVSGVKQIVTLFEVR